MAEAVALAADPIILVPGSPEWVREMTASKVAAVLGLSPWQSPYSLWYEMAGVTPHQTGTPEMEGGHWLEPSVAAWTADRFGLGVLRPGQCWRNRARPWQVASPDRLTGMRLTAAGHIEYHAKAVVEVKTARKWESWGPDGTDDIPPYYRAQVVWQCDTLGLPLGYVGVLLPYLEFRGYVIEPAVGEAEYIRSEARAFLDSLDAGDPPDLDASEHTYRTIRVLNPALDEGFTVEVPYDLARDYCAAVTGRKEAEKAELGALNRLAVHMGTAHKAEYLGQKIAHRQTNGRGLPYIKAATKFPVIEEEDPNA